VEHRFVDEPLVRAVAVVASRWVAHGNASR
jgi:hypothetical protein